jgi:hypothetical protein
MKTCACGGMIVEGWDTCRFCGRPVGASTDSPPPPPPAAFYPPGGAGAPPPPHGQPGLAGQPGTPGEPDRSGRSGIPTWAIVVGVVVVIGLMASFFLGGDDGDSGAGDTSTELATDDLDDGATTAPPTSGDPQAQLAADVGSFCEGDRSAVPAAVPYDGAPGRIHPIIGLGNRDVAKPDGWTRSLTDSHEVELALCQDLVPGTETDGNVCDGYSTNVLVQMVDAQYTLRLYAVQSGEVLAEATVTTSGDGCPMDVFYDVDEIDAGMVREHHNPPWRDVKDFVAPFVAP